MKVTTILLTLLCNQFCTAFESRLTDPNAVNAVSCCSLTWKRMARKDMIFESSTAIKSGSDEYGDLYFAVAQRNVADAGRRRAMPILVDGKESNDSDTFACLNGNNVVTNVNYSHYVLTNAKNCSIGWERVTMKSNYKRVATRSKYYPNINGSMFTKIKAEHHHVTYEIGGSLNTSLTHPSIRYIWGHGSDISGYNFELKDAKYYELLYVDCVESMHSHLRPKLVKVEFKAKNLAEIFKENTKTAYFFTEVRFENNSTTSSKEFFKKERMLRMRIQDTVTSSAKDIFNTNTDERITNCVRNYVEFPGIGISSQLTSGHLNRQSTSELKSQGNEALVTNTITLAELNQVAKTIDIQPYSWLEFHATNNQIDGLILPYTATYRIEHDSIITRPDVKSMLTSLGYKEKFYEDNGLFITMNGYLQLDSEFNVDVVSKGGLLQH